MLLDVVSSLNWKLGVCTVYSSLRNSATAFAVESLRLVRGVTSDLLLLGAVLSTRRLFCMLLSILHCQAMLRKNSGNRSSLKVKAQGEKD